MIAQPTLVIMVKRPAAGAVKTRLARDIGHVAATRFYRVTSRNIVRRLSADVRWTTKLAVTPGNVVNPSDWSFLGDGNFRNNFIAQGNGNLGDRMQRIFNLSFPGPVAIIGTDIPEIMPAHIENAFRILKQKDAVIGPAGDGGYWLIGLRRVPRILKVFNGVMWSSKTTFDDTIRNLEDCDVGICTMLNDVDELEDYQRLSYSGSRVVCSRAE